MRTRLVNLFVGLTVSVAALAQQTTQTQESYTFSLEECIDYALKNSNTNKNAALDVVSYKAKVGEVTAIGLPQANITGTHLVNPQVQSQFVPANIFDKSAPSNIIVPLGLGIMYSTSATLAVTQLIFDGTFFVGLQASKALVELSKRAQAQTEIQTIENVTKAYYMVVINKERRNIFDANISRLDSTLKQLTTSQKQGFVEDIDVKRIQVALNNLQVEKQKFQSIELISLGALKLQMGLPQSTNLDVKTNITDLNIDANVTEDASFDYGKRTDYATLDARRKLLEYDVKQYNMAYLPRLVGFFNYGQNTGANEIKDLFVSTKWREFHNYGLSLNVPVFDGLSKSYKIQQAKVNISKAENDLNSLSQAIDFQRTQSANLLKNNLKTLESQKRNLELSLEVARVAKLKYLNGVGSNLEVITAESSLKESQINYYSSLYDAVLSKIDFDKANGNLK